MSASMWIVTLLVIAYFMAKVGKKDAAKDGRDIGYARAVAETARRFVPDSVAERAREHALKSRSARQERREEKRARRERERQFKREAAEQGQAVFGRPAARMPAHSYKNPSGVEEFLPDTPDSLLQRLGRWLRLTRNRGVLIVDQPLDTSVDPNPANSQYGQGGETNGRDSRSGGGQSGDSGDQPRQRQDWWWDPYPPEEASNPDPQPSRAPETTSETSDHAPAPDDGTLEGTPVTNPAPPCRTCADRRRVVYGQLRRQTGPGAYEIVQNLEAACPTCSDGPVYSAEQQSYGEPMPAVLAPGCRVCADRRRVVYPQLILPVGTGATELIQNMEAACPACSNGPVYSTEQRNGAPPMPASLPPAQRPSGPAEQAADKPEPEDGVQQPAVSTVAANFMEAVVGFAGAPVASMSIPQLIARIREAGDAMTAIGEFLGTLASRLEQEALFDPKITDQIGMGMPLGQVAGVHLASSADLAQVLYANWVKASRNGGRVPAQSVLVPR